MSNYLLELAAIHVTLMLAYWFFLRKEQQYATLRFYLLSATLLALVIPLLKLPKLFGSTEPIYTTPTPGTTLEAITIAPTDNDSIWNLELLTWGYLAVSIILLLKFLGSILYIIQLERRSSYEKFNSLYIRKTKYIEGSFSFFGWIFMSQKIDNNQPDYAVILQHEQAHASLGHTYDVLFFELFKVCFWWLPTAWRATQEIKKIHEYQADAYALKSYSIAQYSSILISSTLKSNGLSLASSFHHGFIKKRLNAMKNQAKNISPWKLGSLSVLGALLFVVFACSEELDQEIKEMGSQSNSITFDQLPSSMQTDLAEIKSDLSFMKVNVPNGEEDMSKIGELQDLDPELIHAINVDKSDRAIYLALKKDGANFNYLADKSKMDGELFTVVEEMPEYVGGMNAFYRYIASEIVYPSEARKTGVQGKVFVQFVVEKDGSLTDVQAIKGIGEGCDDEAVRVVKNSPAFKPGEQRGKPVRVRMVVPITFKLNEDNSTQGKIIAEQARVINNQFKVDANYANGIWSGTVYDENGKAFPGVNILVAGTTTGTVSNLEGSFSLKAEESSDLVVSAVGYESIRLEGK